MVEEQPMYLTNLCYTAGDFRREIQGLICQEGVSTFGPLGAGTSLKVATGGSGLNLQVSPGRGYIIADPAGEGAYFISTDVSSTTLTATTADPTNPRIDRITATVRDSDFGGTDDDWVLQIIAGTPTVGANLTNLSGVANEPDSSLTLAYVLVPAAFAGPFVDATHILDVRNEFVVCGDRNVRSTSFTRATNQSTTDAAVTTVTYTANTGTATGSAWLTEASGVVTVKRAGVYQISGYINWAANATGYRRVAIAAGTVNFAQQWTTSPVTNTDANASQVVSLAAGDTITMTGRQNSGGALNIALATLVVTRLGTLVP